MDVQLDLRVGHLPILASRNRHAPVTLRRPFCEA
jgi:hypothetical protein